MAALTGFIHIRLNDTVQPPRSNLLAPLYSVCCNAAPVDGTEDLCSSCNTRAEFRSAMAAIFDDADAFLMNPDSESTDFELPEVALTVSRKDHTDDCAFYHYFTLTVATSDVDAATGWLTASRHAAKGICAEANHATRNTELTWSEKDPAGAYL